MRSTGAVSYEPQILVEWARLAEPLGNSAGRTDLIREANRLFIAMGATGRVERVTKELSRSANRAATTTLWPITSAGDAARGQPAHALRAGIPNPPDHRFCGKCGAALEGSAPVAKQADTPRVRVSEKADPESLDGKRKTGTCLC